MGSRALATALAAGLLLTGCAAVRPGSLGKPPADPQGPIELEGIPFFPQELHQCGPAALATVLVYAGGQATPQGLADQVYVPGRKGSLQVELAGATRRAGLVPYPIAPRLDALLTELRGGRPVLVLLDLGSPGHPVWHYAVVVGYDPQAYSMILRSGATRRKVMSEGRFRAAWGRGGAWGLLVLRPGELPAQVQRSPYLAAVAALEAVGQYGPAERAYRAALTPWPEDPTVLLGIGNSLYGQGDKRGAEESFRRLIRTHPEAIPAYNNLAQVLAEQGQRARARAILAQGLSKTPPDHPLRPTLEATRAALHEDDPRSGVGQP